MIKVPRYEEEGLWVLCLQWACDYVKNITSCISVSRGGIYTVQTTDQCWYWTLIKEGHDKLPLETEIWFGLAKKTWVSISGECVLCVCVCVCVDEKSLVFLLVQSQTWIFAPPGFAVVLKHCSVVLSPVCLQSYTLLLLTLIYHCDSSVSMTSCIVHCKTVVFLSPPQVFVLVCLLRSALETSACSLRL